jgi:hypothetical protein
VVVPSFPLSILPSFHPSLLPTFRLLFTIPETRRELASRPISARREDARCAGPSAIGAQTAISRP